MSRDPEDTAIDRYAAVTQVLARVAAGMTLSQAIREVVKTPQRGLSGKKLRLSRRTLQRHLAAYQAGGIKALQPASRREEAPSQVLSDDFVRFLVATKTADPEASIPEVIRRAHQSGLNVTDVTRISVWRAARRLNLPIFARKGPTNDDMRRFAYAHRLQMVLADGKHFRAGREGKRRVVITLLDDATRFALGAVVGTSESTELFHAGLWKVLRRWGSMQSFFLDNGPGFIAKDTALVCARLNIGLILGTAGYPEGHGKIERYHRTLTQDLLRSWRGDPTVDPALSALELRIEHYLRHDYNRRPHESLNGQTPEQRFLSDSLPLVPLLDVDAARRLFVIAKIRKVSHDNVIKVRGVLYEMPRGHAGKRVQAFRHMLDGTIYVMHEGRPFELSPVDLVLNAVSRRGQGKSKPAVVPIPAKTAATMAFDKDHPMLVDDDGNYFEE